MHKREIMKLVRGQKTTDGAGVKLMRVIGYSDVYDFDPFLMLDSFDSKNPLDYTAGFPMHPHRGIETITYLIAGKIEHEDSLGNKGEILSGESQWMTGGSGILHQEMPKPSDRMLGYQLWLNLPKAEKMAEPAYLSITCDKIAHVTQGKAEVLVLSGRYRKAEGVTPGHISATIYDVKLPPGEAITIETKPEDKVFIFLIAGDAVISGQTIPSKTAVLFGVGEVITVAAPPSGDLRFAHFAAKPLHEPVAWGGPIVMNTQQELKLAFEELGKGEFIKHG